MTSPHGMDDAYTTNLAAETVARSPHLSSVDCASMLYIAALSYRSSCCIPDRLRGAILAIERRVATQCAAMDSKLTVAALWALSHFHEHPTPCLMRLLRRAQLHAGELDSSEVCAVLWAVAKVGFSAPWTIALVGALLGRLTGEELWKDLSAVAVSNALWAMAKMGLVSDRVAIVPDRPRYSTLGLFAGAVCTTGFYTPACCPRSMRSPSLTPSGHCHHGLPWWRDPVSAD